MADTLRTVAQEAVARVEGAPPPPADKITDHGKQVAGVLRAEADKDVFTTLQIAAGEQVSPAILRANLDVSIGILKADGLIERAVGTPYESRHNRAKEAIKLAEVYFDDKTTFETFAASTEGRTIVDNTGMFLMTHPALSEYFANITDQGERKRAAKALAKQYLKDPFAREKVRQALLESAINKGEVPDEYSEVARKKDALTAKVSALEAKVKKLEGDPSVPVIGEIESLKARRKEFDRYSDPTLSPPLVGEEFKLTQQRITEIAGLKSDIVSLDNDIRTLRAQESSLLNEQRRMQKIVDAGGTPPKDPADVGLEITGKQTDISNKLSDKSTKEGEKAAKEAEIKAIEEDKRQYDEKIRERIQEAKALHDELSRAKDERDEQVLKLKKMEAAKGRSEELAVSELENIFKKGIEQELMERLDRAKEAADKAMEESAAKEKDIDEKQYLELRAKRHKSGDKKADNEAINEDFKGMMRASTEYHIVRNTDNTVHISAKNPDGNWVALTSGATAPTAQPPGSETFYLTGPEFSILQMMNNTNEFGSKFMLGKLKDSEWLKAESEAFAIQTLRDKMYASRSWFQRRGKNGVKRLSSKEITTIKNSTWGVNMLEQALVQNKDQIDQLDAAMKGGALQGEILRGPGTWREKIGRMNNKQIALLILALSAGGALFGTAVAAGVGAVGASGLGLSSLSGLMNPQVGGALAGATAGGVAARRSRS